MVAGKFRKCQKSRIVRIVHQVRNTLKYIPDNDRKLFASDLKAIYHAATEEKAREALERVNEKWTPKYTNDMKHWYDNWDAVSRIFKFLQTVRNVFYTTNSIENLTGKSSPLKYYRDILMKAWCGH